MRSQDARKDVSATKTRSLRRLLLEALEEGTRIRMAAVGERIKQARQEAGLTQDDLAELVGVGMRQIQYYEAGDSDPYRKINKIAEVTNQSVGWLLHGDPVTGSDVADQGIPPDLESLLLRLEGGLLDLLKGQAEILERLGKLQWPPEVEAEQPQTRPRRTR
jgi:transcriptional regulator with XRE-family HTH domain